MSDEVLKRFAAALAIKDGGRVTFAAATGSTVASPHSFAVDHLLLMQRRKLDPRSVMGTLTSVWDLGKKLKMRSQGDQYVMKFTREDDQNHIVVGGPWFYGRALFMAAEYDGLCDVASVPIDSFPVWVEVIGLPPKLLTDDIVELVGSTLGSVINLDALGIQKGTRAKVKIIHQISDPVKKAYPPMQFEFEFVKAVVTLSFKYEKTMGFCHVCGLLGHPSSGCLGPPNMSKV